MSGIDTSAQSYARLDGGRSARLNERLYASLRRAHQEGVRDMSRRELRDFHHRCTGEFLELSSVASTVHALLAAGRVLEGVERPCVLPPHRIVRPVRCALRQSDV